MKDLFLVPRGCPRIARQPRLAKAFQAPSYPRIVLSLLLATWIDSPVIGANLIRIALPGYPSHLHYAVAAEQQARAINQLVAETLLGMDLQTGVLSPRLAKRTLVEKKDSAWILELDPEARFQDGEKVTAQDVVFSWDLAFATDSKALALQQTLSNWQRPEALSSERLRFQARERRYGMLQTLADFYILSRKSHAKSGYSRTELVGSGPYFTDSVVDGVQVRLRRNPEYWANNRPWAQIYPRTKQIEFTVETDPRLAWEKMKQGQFDYLYALSSQVWAGQIQLQAASLSNFAPLEFRSQLPSGVAVILWNHRRTGLKERSVRCALQALMDREFWVEKILARSYDVAEGLFPRNSPSHAPNVRAATFAPERAARFLDESGWKKGPDGWRARSGMRLSFEMLLENPAHERLMSVYQEQLQRVGIELRLRTLDWASRKRRLENHDFDAALSFRATAGLDQLDEEWGGKFADKVPSLNRTGFHDQDVDRWLTALHGTFDEGKRQALHRNIERRLVETCAVGIGWEATITRVVVNKSVLDPKAKIPPFADWTQAFWTQAFWTQTLPVSVESETKISSARSALK